MLVLPLWAISIHKNDPRVMTSQKNAELLSADKTTNCTPETSDLWKGKNKQTKKTLYISDTITISFYALKSNLSAH